MAPDEGGPARRAQVVGLGLVGTSVALALKARGWRVTGRDCDAARALRARELGALDEVGTDHRAEIGFVATPVAVVAAEAEALLAGDETGKLVVTDVGGVKGPIVAAVRSPRFVGGHPMAGSEQEGPDGADPDLFTGATWVLTPTSTTDPGAFSTIQAVVVELGADTVALAPARHDELVALVSHVPHLTAATMMGLATEATDAHTAVLRLAAGGFRDMTRIAAGATAIWPDICRDNAGAIVPILDDLIARLNEVRRIVAEEDRAGLVALLDRARLARRNLPPRASRPSSVADLHVLIPDRPGALAQVMTIAGELGVNIEDFEIIHSQQQPRGVLVLTLAADAAPRVREALREHGFGMRRGPDHRPLIAIDGPAGSGKSTVGREVAARLGLERLDTGAMYRAVTLAALDAGVDPDDGEALGALARAMSLSVDERVVLDGRDVTELIREPRIDDAVSAVSAHPEVRSELVRRQRAWVVTKGGGVVEGRDIGSVVLPEADLKIYLTAAAEVRANRRAAEQAEEDPEAAARSMARRDRLDSGRALSPLAKAPDAIELDSTGKSVETVVAEVLSHL